MWRPKPRLCWANSAQTSPTNPRNSGGYFLPQQFQAPTSTDEAIALNKPPSVLFLIHSLAPAGSQGETAWNAGKFLASNRIQLEPAKQAVIELGFAPKLLNLRAEKPNCLQLLGNPSCCIVGKLNHPDEAFAQNILLANLAAISSLKSRSIPVLVNYSDNLAAPTNKSVATLYRSLLWHADAVIYPCKAMQQLGKPWLNQNNPAQEWIIEDPWQVEELPYRQLNPDQPCRIIWYGHSSNAQYLLKGLPKLLQFCNAHANYELTILSDSATQTRVKQQLKQSPQCKPWRLRYVQWDNNSQPAQLNHELTRAHIAIIPSDIQDKRKLAASHNRAVDAIQAGCMVIASPLPSYKELSKLLLLSEDFGGTINAGIQQYSRLTNKWQVHRKKHMERFSPSSNAAKWREIIGNCTKT